MSKARQTSFFSYLSGWNAERYVRIAWTFILVVMVIAIIGPLIANEKPYRCKLEGVIYYPLFSGTTEAELSARHPAVSPVNWRTTVFESIWFPPIPYSFSTIDLRTGNHISPVSKQPLPLRFRHWLGTDILGRDVLAGMIRGCRISLLIGVGSMLLALLIGVPVGSASAYWGNRDWKITWYQLIAGCIFLFLLCCVWIFHLSLAQEMFFSILIFIIGMLTWIGLRNVKSKKISFPLDTFVMGLISTIDSFPGLFIIMVLLVMIPVKGWITVMTAIALLRWPVMARYMRAEVFKLKESNYIKSAKLLNLSDLHILRRQLIPFAFRPVMISFIFGISSAILAESALSFLGIGLPAEEVNWGRLLSQSRNHFDDWWLVLFPGCAIFFTMLSLYTIGNALQKRMEKSSS
jgi:peptide/nickel transport system permease protein